MSGSGDVGIGASVVDGALTINGTGDINGTTSGISANATGLGTVFVNVSGNVTGSTGAGIYATANGGNLAVTALGAVTGNAGAGIDVSTASGTLIVNGTGAINGTTAGISAVASGAGAINVNGTGNVVGGTGAGISANSGGGDVSVTQNGTISGNSGITASSNGSGNVTITGFGTVTGTGGYGIVASVETGVLTVEGAGNINGTTGIFANATGSGTVTINVTGIVTGTNAGIDARSAGGDVSVTSGIVSGSMGITALTTDGGNVTIVAAGTINGTGSVGITGKIVDGTLAIGGAGDIVGSAQGISANATGIGAVTVNGTGNVTGGTGAAILAKSLGGDVLIAQTGAISGNAGILASTNGSGNMTISGFGSVTGTGSSGIAASVADGTLTINGTGNVNGTTTGISANATGSGAVTVNVTGNVTGTNAGIDARSAGGDVSVTSGRVSGSKGITALTTIWGNVTIVAGGTINGTGSVGITGKIANGTLTIGGAGDITGAGQGISANATGIGAVTINGTGNVTSSLGAAIVATSAGGDVSVAQTGAIGGFAGISASTISTGNVTISGFGTVSGSGDVGLGVSVVDGALTINGTSNISGNTTGISANATGIGAVTINVSGNVSGGRGAGIYALSAGGDVSVTSAVVSGQTGIAVSSTGSGNVTVASHGNVTGVSSGIEAQSDSGSINVSIDPGVLATADGGIGVSLTSLTGDVSASTTAAGDFIRATNGTAIYATTSGNVTIGVAAGTDVTGLSATSFGIDVDSVATTSVAITNNGTIQGGIAAIRVNGTTLGTTITNNATGSILSFGSDPQGLAVSVQAGSTLLGNSGTLVGNVALLGANNIINNNAGGTWSVYGASSFGGGTQVVNNAGTLQTFLTGTPNTGPVTANLTGVTTFNNSNGLVSMQNNIAGDQIVMNGATFNGTGTSRIALDANVGGAGSIADVLVVGNTTGTTTILVHDSAAGTPGATNTAGIVLVRTTGTSSASDFTLQGGPITKGMYFYDLAYRPASGTQLDNEFVLVSAPGGGIYAVTPLGSVAQRLSFDVARIWIDRQAELRTQAMAPADAGGADKFEGRATSVWATALTTDGQRRQINTFTVLDKSYDHDTSYDYRSGGYVGGIDRRVTGVGGVDGVLMVGAYGGYLTSSMQMKALSTSVALEGGTMGAYATYLQKNFFIDGTIKGEILRQAIQSGALGLTGPAAIGNSVKSYGGLVDAGYRFQATATTFAEGFGGLATVKTDLPSFDAMSQTVSFGSQQNVSTRYGMRVGTTGALTDGYRIDIIANASVWNRVYGHNATSIGGGSDTAFVIMDKSLRSFGDVGVSLDVTGFSTGWSGFLKGDYQFAAGFKSTSASAGLRYRW